MIFSVAGHKSHFFAVNAAVDYHYPAKGCTQFFLSSIFQNSKIIYSRTADDSNTYTRHWITPTYKNCKMKIVIR